MPLPDYLEKKIHCRAAPTGKYTDSHCDKVFLVAREFCREHAVHDSIALGNKTYLHEEYLRGWEQNLHIAYIMKNIDDYRITVQKKRHCYEEIGGEFAQWKERTPVYDQCLSMLWASWSQCKFS